MTEPRQDRSLGELFGDLAEQLSRLIRQEADLARTEVTANLTRVARDASMLGIGGGIAHAGMLAIVAAVIALLARLGLDVWVAAGVVGVVLIGIGLVLIDRGRSQLASTSVVPTRTVESLQEDVEWARNQTK